MWVASLGAPTLQPAENFGLGGGGLAWEIPGTDGALVERFRADDHEPFGPHLNVETILKKLGRRKAHLGNEHVTEIG